MFRQARIHAYTSKNIISAFETTEIVPFNLQRVLSCFTNTAATDPKGQQASLLSALLSMLVTPSNTCAIYCIHQDAFADFDIAEKPRLGIFIDKLVNAAVGG